MSPRNYRLWFWLLLALAAVVGAAVLLRSHGPRLAHAPREIDVAAAPARSAEPKQNPAPVDARPVAAAASGSPRPIWRRDDSVASDRTLLQPYATAWSTETKPAFAPFNAWAKRYAASDSGARRAMLPEGIALAETRRAAMIDLIKADPAAALASAVPAPVRDGLPAEILSRLERRLAGVGNYEVHALTPGEGQTISEPIKRSAVIDGQRYAASVYGRRVGESTKFDIPLHGITADQRTVALHASPVRVLDSGEVPSRAKRSITNCPISGMETSAAATSATNLQAATSTEVGNEYVHFCEASHLAAYTQERINSENQPGPNVSAISADPSTPYTIGNKKVLVIRVDFSDRAGDPIALGSAQNLMNDQVAPFFDDASFHKTTLAVTVSSKTYRMPRTAQSYATTDTDGFGIGDSLKLHSDARAAFDADGANTLKTSGYDRIILFFAYLGDITNSEINYGGLGELGGPYAWVNGEFDFRVTAHELGHTYGLYHANLWKVSAGSKNPVGSGFSLEYGDPFDTMAGGSTAPEYHYNPWFKNQLGWLDDARVTTVNGDGVFRIYRFDDGDANQTHTMAVVIDRGDSPNDDANHHFYWIGFRKAIATPALQNGAYIFWGYDYHRQSELLDLNTPGSQPSDAPLAIGSSFTDSSNGVSIRPLGQGGSGADAWLDVQVTFGNRLDLSQAEYDVDEQSGIAKITINRSGSGLGPITVHYTTSNGSAGSSDYTATSGNLTWANGDVAPKTVSVVVKPDATNEGTENFKFTLSSISAGFLGRSVATVRINDPAAIDQSFDASLTGDASSLIVLPDGRIAVVSAGGVVELNGDGATDSAFASLAANGAIHAAVVQPDGKVIVAGAFTTVGNTTRNRIARLNTNGTVDATFNPGVGADGEVRALALQPDGAVVIGGVFHNVRNTARNYVARLNANGTLDAAFTSPLPDDASGTQAVESIALQPDDKVVLGGKLSASNDVVARLTPAGALDGGFAAVFGNAGSRALAVAMQIDGSIVVGGNFTSFSGVAHYRIARLAANGVPDNGFLASVDADIAFSGTPQPFVQALAVQSDGRILLGGEFAKVDGVSAARFSRVNADGSLDSTFAVGTGSEKPVTAFAIQADGRIVMSAGSGSIKGTTGSVVRLFGGQAQGPGAARFDAPGAIAFNGGALELPVERVVGSNGRVSINYATVAGTALPGVDYQAANGTLTWEDGDAASKTVIVNLLTTQGTNDKTFVVNLGTPIGMAVGSPAFSNVTVVTGDVAPNQPVNVSPAAGAIDVELTPTLSASAYADLNAGDTHATSQWLVRVAGESAPLVNVTSASQLSALLLSGSTALATSTTYEWQVRYQDNHGAWSAYSAPSTFTTRAASVVQFSQPFYNVAENGTEVQVEVSRLVSTLGELQVNYATADETARNLFEYLTQSATLTFADGEDKKVITLAIVDNQNAEGDKRFKIELSNLVGVAQLGAIPVAHVLIHDDEISSFVPWKGNYYGLVQADSAAGYVTLSLTSKGTFTGSFKLSGVKHRLKGKFDFKGTYSTPLSGTNPPLTLKLDLDQSSGSSQVIGSLVNANNEVVAAIVTSQDTFSKNSPASQAGRYTVLLPADAADVTSPPGTGYGTVTVDGKGKLKFAGVLGDGTKVSQGAKISRAGAWPLYISLYQGQGEIVGEVIFRDLPQASDLDGVLRWSKPSVGFKVHPTLIGSRYQPPAANGRSLPVRDGSGNSRITFANGNIGVDRSALLTWAPGDVITPVANAEYTGNFGALTVKVAKKTGLLSGTFIESGGATTRAWSGAVLTKQLIGGGIFTGNGAVGSVKLIEVPKPL